jgi:hypothetical protein
MIRLLRFRNIGSKLVAICLWMGIVPVAVTGYLSYSKARDALLDSTGQSLQIAAETMARELDRQVADRSRDAQSFAIHPFALGTPQQLHDLANQFVLHESPFYDLMVVADREGRVIAASDILGSGEQLGSQVLLGRSVRDEEWFQKCLTGELGQRQIFCGDVQ